MGEANRRGTFEEPKASAINLQNIENAENKAKRQSNTKSTLKTNPANRVEICSGNRRDQYKSMRLFAMLTAMGYGFGQSEWPAKPEEDDDDRNPNEFMEKQ